MRPCRDCHPQGRRGRDRGEVESKVDTGWEAARSHSTPYPGWFRRYIQVQVQVCCTVEISISYLRLVSPLFPNPQQFPLTGSYIRERHSLLRGHSSYQSGEQLDNSTLHHSGSVSFRVSVALSLHRIFIFGSLHLQTSPSPIDLTPDPELSPPELHFLRTDRVAALPRFRDLFPPLQVFSLFLPFLPKIHHGGERRAHQARCA